MVHTPPEQKRINWEESKDLCKTEDERSALVSIETQKELNFLKKKLIEIDPKHEYFIGLNKSHDNKWKWISGNGTVAAPVECGTIFTLSVFPYATVKCIMFS